MDDVDRELKAIQLQRERLALERELALKGVANAAGAAAAGIGSVAARVTSIVRAVFAFFAQWWRRMLMFAVLAGAAAGAIALKLEHDEKQKWAAYTAEQERLRQARATFVNEQCPEQIYQCGEALTARADACFMRAKGAAARLECERSECTEGRARSALAECRAKATQDFTQQNQ